MKVLKRGTLPEEKEVQATCGYCKSELEFMPSEAKKIFDSAGGVEYYKVICPVCCRHVKTLVLL